MAPTNVKSDASQLPPSSDHAEILKQVEFYFGDNNLPYDKFLWTETQKHDGWISIQTIHSFKRMQRFQPYEEVVAALRKSVDLLEVSEDGDKVRRKTPIRRPEPQENQVRFARTVYAKGFGEETATSQFDIEAFFQTFGPLNQVRLRRTEDGTFKGSVFVEFKELADAQKLVEQSEKPKFQDQELVVMSKQAYVEMKSEQHNFADRANGRRKPKFNAYKQMQAQENSAKRGSGRRQTRKRSAEGDFSEGSKRVRPEADSKEADSKETTSTETASTEVNSKETDSKETTSPETDSKETDSKETA